MRLDRALIAGIVAALSLVAAFACIVALAGHDTDGAGWTSSIERVQASRSVALPGPAVAPRVVVEPRHRAPRPAHVTEVARAVAPARVTVPARATVMVVAPEPPARRPSPTPAPAPAPAPVAKPAPKRAPAQPYTAMLAGTSRPLTATPTPAQHEQPNAAEIAEGTGGAAAGDQQSGADAAAPVTGPAGTPAGAPTPAP